MRLVAVPTAAGPPPPRSAARVRRLPTGVLLGPSSMPMHAPPLDEFAMAYTRWVFGLTARYDTLLQPLPPVLGGPDVWVPLPSSTTTRSLLGWSPAPI